MSILLIENIKIIVKFSSISKLKYNSKSIGIAIIYRELYNKRHNQSIEVINWGEFYWKIALQRQLYSSWSPFRSCNIVVDHHQSLSTIVQFPCNRTYKTGQHYSIAIRYYWISYHIKYQSPQHKFQHNSNRICATYLYSHYIQKCHGICLCVYYSNSILHVRCIMLYNTFTIH